MKKATYTAIYNRKNKLSKDGTAQILICAYYNQKRKYFATGIKIAPEFWNKKQNKIRNTHPNAAGLQIKLSELTAKMERIELEQSNNGKPFSLEYLAERLDGNNSRSNFIEFMEREIELNRTTIAAGSYLTEISILKGLKRYKNVIYFDDINYSFLTELLRYLQSEGLKPNTINMYFTYIKKYLNVAINKNYFDLNKYPFRQFKNHKEETRREHLEPEEITIIENIKLTKENEYLQPTKDMFLFAVYTGLRYSDVIALKSDNIKTIHGKTWIELIMQKTTEPLKIPLYLLFDGKPIEILKRYTRADRNIIFDYVSNLKINQNLTTLCTLAGINKKITFHIARHTNAMYLLYKNVSITTIQKLLGHKKLQTTQIYSRTTDKMIINELQNVKFDNK